jgi:putative flavoprotein involved in K+ transport
MSERTQSYDTIVVGAGQAGLATGYYLQQQGRDFTILDSAERIGDSWRARWDSLRLFTPARYNNLPGMPFPAPPFHYPTKDEMAAYLEAYASRFELPVRMGTRVVGLSSEGNEFVLTAENPAKASSRALRFAAKNVVVATGYYRCPNVPPFASELTPDIVQIHSSDYRRPSQLQEGPAGGAGAGSGCRKLGRRNRP